MQGVSVNERLGSYPAYLIKLSNSLLGLSSTLRGSWLLHGTNT